MPNPSQNSHLPKDNRPVAWIRYSKTDQTFVDALSESLASRGIRSEYIALSNVLESSPLRARIFLTNSLYFIIVLTPGLIKEYQIRKQEDLTFDLQPTPGFIIIWHNVTADKIREFSPSLADAAHFDSKEGLDTITGKIHDKPPSWDATRLWDSHIGSPTDSSKLTAWRDLLTEYDPNIDETSQILLDRIKKEINSINKSVEPEQDHPKITKPLQNRFLRKPRSTLYSSRLSSKVPEPTSHSARPLHVFLCHAKENKDMVRQLHQRLKTQNIEPWLDAEDILPGENWEQEIRKAVRTSDVVLVCLTPRSINKAGYVQREIKFALDIADEKPDGTIYVIPAKLEECEVPESLRRYQWVNLFEPNGFDRLLRSLRKVGDSLGIKI